MERSKEYFLIMREEEFNALEEQTRAKFTHVELREADEWLNNRDDEHYVKLKNAERLAKKQVQQYLYDKRNNNFKNR